MMTMLSGCRTSPGSAPASPLNPVPPDVRSLFNRNPPAPRGQMNRQESLAYMGRLVVEIKRRNRAGKRLIFQIDRARRFHRVR